MDVSSVASAQIICCICQDKLAARAENDCLVATICGHLYHKDCLSDWFKKNCRPSRILKEDSEAMLKGQCPVCCTPQWLKRCIRVYPSCDEQEINQARLKIELLETRLVTAQSELDDTKQQLHKAKTSLKQQTHLVDSLNKAQLPTGLPSAVTKTRSGRATPCTPTTIKSTLSSIPERKKVVARIVKEKSGTGSSGGVGGGAASRMSTVLPLPPPTLLRPRGRPPGKIPVPTSSLSLRSAAAESIRPQPAKRVRKPADSEGVKNAATRL